MDYSIDNSLNKILNQLDKRQEKVIKNRYGLNGKKYTLQEIGDDLGVTRERVRQIENHTSKKVKPLIKKEFSQLIKKSGGYFKENLWY